MKRCLIDASGNVVNVVLAGDNWVPPEGLTLGPEGGNIGDTWDGSAYVKPTPPPSDTSPIVPDSVSPYQARRALHDAGLLPAVEAAMASASVEAKLAWEYATVFERSSPFIASLAPALGMTEQQIDQLFIAASQV